MQVTHTPPCTNTYTLNESLEGLLSHLSSANVLQVNPHINSYSSVFPHQQLLGALVSQTRAWKRLRLAAPINYMKGSMQFHPYFVCVPIYTLYLSHGYH